MASEPSFEYLGGPLSSQGEECVDVCVGDSTPGLQVRVPDTHSHPAG